jgi:hypothetical protein
VPKKHNNHPAVILGHGDGEIHWPGDKNKPTIKVGDGCLYRVLELALLFLTVLMTHTR